MYWSSEPVAALRRDGVPAYRDVEAAVGALAELVEVEERPRFAVPAIEPEAEPVIEAGYLEARELLAAAGVVFPPARRAASADEAVAVACELGYPVAVKALGLLHKSDAGGVVLGLPSDAAVVAAVRDMDARLQPEAYSVEAMADTRDAVELIVGCRRDRRFGPLVLVGLGGVYAELLRDTQVALAPASADELEQLLLRLRGAAVMRGARGRPPVHIRAAAEAASALSRIASAHPEIAEIEINPLLVTPSAAIGLDALIVPVERQAS
jgi:acyl-CoA synthetase (NDP forming)